ncbi:MAG: hypothetical protein O7I93_09265 [Gemmatimonadetes bacterium]|nr:hypothetical protein [Gemmatimonadota bacterium]
MSTPSRTPGRALILAISLSCSTAPEPAPGQARLVDVPIGKNETVTLLVIEPDQPVTTAPVILAFPWGAGTLSLLEGMLATYWDPEAVARGYNIVGVQVLGSSLETEGVRVIPAVLDWMDANLSYDRSKVVAVGASNGGRGVFHAVLTDPDRFAALVAMPGQYGGDGGDLAPLAGKDAWLMVGELDTGWRAPTDDTKDRLESQGVTVRVDVVPGQGHVLSLSQNLLMDWIDGVLGR